MLKQIKISYLLILIITIFGIVGCGDIIDIDENRTAPPTIEDNNGTSPEDNNGTTPPEDNNGTSPEDNNGTSPEDNNGTTPPEDNNGTSPEEKEHKGHYLDSNVSGIEYISEFGCENQDYSKPKYKRLEGMKNPSEPYICERNITGITTADGTFEFISGGDDVIFSIAGLQLDYIEPKYLLDNANITVKKTDGKLASFLQSMDNDGNASNGIVIEKEVVAILKDLNISQYNNINSSELDIEGLLSQVEEKLDENSTIHLRYINEEEALEHLRLTIEKYTPSSSSTVKKVIGDIKNLFENVQDLSEEEIQEKVEKVRKQLNNPMNDDRGIVDIQVAQALLELSELTNQTYLEDVLTFNGDPSISKLSKFIKNIALSQQDELVVPKDENSTNVIEDSRKSTKYIATNLKNISDKLGRALASVPQYYTFEHGDLNLSIDSITTLRGYLLYTASNLTLSTAYYLGEDANYIPKIYKDANGNSYEYQDINIKKDKLLNKEGYGVANNQVALSLAKEYLLQSASLLKNLSTRDNNNDFAKLYKVLYNGNGTIEDKGKVTTKRIAINRLFDINTTLSPSDFGTNWKYTCKNGFTLATEEEAKIQNKVYCYNQLGDIKEADLNATTKPEAETSKLDELITEITVDGSRKTGQELIDYLLEN